MDIENARPGLDIIEKLRKAYAWVVVPCLLIILSGLYFLIRSPTAWDFVGEHYSQIYYAAKAITAVACFIYGVVILVLNRNALSAPEEWLRYIGWAFVMLFAMYFLSFSLEAIVFGQYFSWQLPLKNIIFTGLSATNNLLFLAAAFKLVDRPPFPKWSIYLQGSMCLLGLLLSFNNVAFSRIPGVLASAFCISWLGYALYINIYRPTSTIRNTTYISASLRRDFAKTVLITAVAYFALEVAFSLNPYIANRQWNGRFVSAGPIIENKIKPRLPGSYTAQMLQDAKVQVLDAGVFAALFILKFIIFAAVFLLLLDAIIILSANRASNIFKPIFEANREFLTNSGITKSIADTVGATSVELYIKIPGKEKSEFVRFQWPRYDKLESPEKILEAKLSDFVRRAFQRAEEQKLPNRSNEKFSLSDYFPLAGAVKLPLQIAEPVIFHGAVIGCLVVTGKEEHSLSRTAVQTIKDLTKFVTLEVQSFRETASLEQIGFRFSRLLIGEEPIKDFKTPIEDVAEYLQDVLSPFAIGLWVDIGLQNLEHKYYAGEEQYRIKLRDWMEGQTSRTGSLEVIEMPLGVKRTSEEEEIRIGRLALLLPKEKDRSDNPILGRNEIYCRTVITRTVAVLIGIAQEYLSQVLQKFGIGLNKAETVETEEWFNRVKKTAEAAGIEWVVVDLRQENRLFTSTSAIKTVEDLKALTDKRQGAEQSYTLSTPLDNANHFVCYRLSASDIYFGVRSSSFTSKLAVPIWKSFLDRFADAANSSIVRIQAALVTMQHLQREKEHAYREAQRLHERSAAAIRIGEMTHQISNTARNFTEPVRALRNALAVGRLRCDSEKLVRSIQCLPDVADQLFYWTASFTNLNKLKETRPCNLQQAALQSQVLYGMFIHQREANLDIDIDPSIQVDLPLHVVTLAISNLVGNSTDVIRPGGVINVTAQVEGDQVCCMVTDKGPGIPLHIQAELFKRDVTTKSNGGGWGLYLTRRSLEEYKGSIRLVHSDANGTTFAIYFPEYKQEEPAKESI